MTLSEVPMKAVKDLSTHITVGFVGSMSSLFVEDGVPLLRGQNIKPYSLDLSNLKFITDDTHRKWKKSALVAGDVAIVRVGYPGTACVIPPGIGSLNAASLVLVRPDPRQLDSHYFCYVLNSPWGKATISGLLVGSAQQVFNTKTAADLEIPYPPLPTQRKIASILSAYDNLIENNTRRIAILEEMAQAIYREWFVNFRFPGHENVKLVDSPLGQIPEGWEASTVGSCGQVIPGYAFKSKDWQESGVPVVKIKNITDDNCVDMESADCVSTSLISERMQKFVLESGDLVIAMTGATAGKAGVLRMRVPSALNQRVAKISPKDGCRSLLWCFLIGNRQLFFNLADGAAQPNMSGGQIESVPLLVPSKPILTQFESCLSDTAQLIDSLFFKNRNLRITRDLLLPKLISGKLDVEDLDIDVGLTAEELEEATT